MCQQIAGCKFCFFAIPSKDTRKAQQNEGFEQSEKAKPVICDLNELERIQMQRKIKEQSLPAVVRPGVYIESVKSQEYELRRDGS